MYLLPSVRAIVPGDLWSLRDPPIWRLCLSLGLVPGITHFAIWCRSVWPGQIARTRDVLRSRTARRDLVLARPPQGLANRPDEAQDDGSMVKISPSDRRRTHQARAPASALPADSWSFDDPLIAMTERAISRAHRSRDPDSSF
jgi:hypothetical protein